MIFSANLFASEADYFTRRNEATDLTQPLERKANEVLEGVLQFVNGCDEAGLRNELFQKLGGMAAEAWPKEAMRAAGARGIPFNDSIYGGSPSAMLELYYTPNVFTIGATVVSADKLSHFFHTGFEMAGYAERRFGPPHGSSTPAMFSETASGRRLSQRIDMYWGVTQPNLPQPATPSGGSTGDREDYVLELSHIQESGPSYGLGLTGVKSYGDIAANLEGFRFWEELTRGPRPYYRCDEGRWRKTRDFAWSDYVSDAWDEAINCSTFSPRVEARVRSRLQATDSRQCPVEAQACASLRSRYGRLSNKILHPRCAGGAEGNGPPPTVINWSPEVAR